MTTSTVPTGLVSRNPDHPISRGLFTPQAGPKVLKSFREAMGVISDRRLGRLLGTKENRYIYRWKTGKFTPGQLYIGRMVVLLAMKYVEQVDFSEVYAIDWETGETLTRKGYEDKGTTTSLRRYLSNSGNRTGASVVGPGSEPFWESGIQPRPKASIP